MSWFSIANHIQVKVLILTLKALRDLTLNDYSRILYHSPLCVQAKLNSPLFTYVNIYWSFNTFALAYATFITSNVHFLFLELLL